METDQIQKQIDFIDNERRKDRAAYATLEQRLSALEGSLPSWIQQIQELNSELTRTKAQLSRFDEIESALVQIRVDQARALEGIEKQRQEHDRELEKVRRSDQEAVTRSLAELRKALEPIPDLKRTLQSRVEEEYRLGRMIEEVDKKVKESARSDEEYTRIAKLTEEGRRQDTKRITDVQGEVAALRKRVDEQRGFNGAPSIAGTRFEWAPLLARQHRSADVRVAQHPDARQEQEERHERGPERGEGRAECPATVCV